MAKDGIIDAKMAQSVLCGNTNTYPTYPTSIDPTYPTDTNKS